MTSRAEFTRRWHSLPEHLKGSQSFTARKPLVRYCQGYLERQTAIQGAEMAVEIERLQKQTKKEI